jgi:hypothetical protein
MKVSCNNSEVEWRTEFIDGSSISTMRFSKLSKSLRDTGRLPSKWGDRDSKWKSKFNANKDPNDQNGRMEGNSLRDAQTITNHGKYLGLHGGFHAEDTKCPKQRL